MAVSGLGQLLVRLGLDASDFTAGLTKAQAAAGKFGASIKTIAIGTAFGNELTRGIDAAVQAFPRLIFGAIDAADALNDMSKRTGVAVETLGGLGFAASQAGGSLETTAAGLGKLNKTIAEAAAGNKEAVEFFSVLGISVRDSTGQLKDAGAVYLEVADKFTTFRDGANKNALALRGFGKAGVEQIAVLNEGGRALQANIDFYKRYGGVTTDTAQRADEFNDTLGKINLLSQSFGRTLAAEMLPSLQALANLWLANKENGDQFLGVASDIVEFFKAVAVAGAFAAGIFVALGRSFGGFIAAGLQLAQFNLSGALSITKETLADIGEAQRRFEAIREAINTTGNIGQKVTQGLNTGSGPRGARSDLRKPDAPGLTAKGAGADDPTKKLLDNRLRAIEGGISRERELLSQRNEFIELYNSQSLLSIEDYYAARRNAQAEALTAEQVGIDKQIALLRAVKPVKATDDAANQGKIAELIERRARIEQQAGADGLKLTFQQTAAVEALGKQFNTVSADVLELQGNLRGAAEIRFDQQTDALKKLFTAEGNKAGLDAIAILRDAALAAADFAKVSNDAGLVVDRLGRAEELLALAVQKGSLTSLQSLAAVGEERRKQIPLMEAQVQAQEAIAKAANDQTLITRAEQARLALEKLKAVADPVGDVLRDAFQGPASDGLFSLIRNTKSAKEAFTDFANSVLDNIARMAAKNLAEQIFGGSSGGGFIGQLVKFFGNFSNPNLQLGGGTTITPQLPGEFATGMNRVPYDGFLARLHKNEAVVPAKYNPAVGGGGKAIQFNIVNNGAPVTAREESREETTQATIVNVVLDAVADDIRRGGRTHEALAGTYGVNRATGAPRRK